MISSPSCPRIAIVLLLLGLGLGQGCTTTSRPSGSGYKSVVATNVLRVAMADAVSQVDLSSAVGKTVTYNTIGFDEDEVGDYLGMLLRDSLYVHGAEFRPDARLRFELQVHAAGVDAQSFFLVPIFDTERTLGEVRADLVVWEDAKQVDRQSIRTRSKYSETTILGFFTTPGVYYHQVEGKWVATEVGDWFVSDLVGGPARRVQKPKEGSGQ